MQGLVASFMASSSMAQLYAAIASVELAGSLGGSLAFAAIFSEGSKLDKSGWSSGLGLPYFSSAVSNHHIP